MLSLYFQALMLNRAPVGLSDVTHDKCKLELGLPNKNGAIENLELWTQSGFDFSR